MMRVVNRDVVPLGWRGTRLRYSGSELSPVTVEAGLLREPKATPVSERARKPHSKHAQRPFMPLTILKLAVLYGYVVAQTHPCAQIPLTPKSIGSCAKADFPPAAFGSYHSFWNIT